MKPAIPFNWPSHHAIKPAEQQRRNSKDQTKKDNSGMNDNDENEDDVGHIDEYA